MQEVNVRAALPPARHNNPIMMAIFVAGLLLYGIVVFSGCFDYSVWHLLATGREIVENGIPYENPFTYHEGMAIIVEQYALCMLLYGLYCLGGFVAIGMWTVLMAGVLVASLYCLGRLVKRDHCGGEWLLALTLLVMPVMQTYIDMTATVYSMIALCWVLFFCERYRRDGNWAWLAALLPLAIVHSAFQMSYALLDVVIVGCYAIPDFLAPLHKRGKLLRIRLADSSYRRLPLLIAMVGVFAGLCVNPYGVKGALYPLLSIGTVSYGSGIAEIWSLAPSTYGVAGVLLVVVLLLAFVAIGWRGAARIDFPLVLLLVCATVLTFLHRVNIWLAMPLAYAIIASAMHGWAIDFARIRNGFALVWTRVRVAMVSRSNDSDVSTAGVEGDTGAAAEAEPARSVESAKGPRLRRPSGGDTVVRYFAAGGICCIGMLVMVLGMSQFAGNIADIEKNEVNYSPSSLVDYMEDEMENAGFKASDVRVFHPLRLGGYLEWRGYDVFVDPRVEIYNSQISESGRDYYSEFYGIMQGEKPTDQEVDTFLDEFEFNYVFADNGGGFEDFLKEREDYSQVISNDEYTLWKRVSPRER